MNAARVMPARPGAPYVPMVVSALLATLTVGALSGAIDLYHLHVVARPVPADHHRAHALAQLFGFMLLMTMGVSLHLAPRLLGGRAPGRATVRWLPAAAIGGLVLVVMGRLGTLVPGTALLGVLGATGLLVATVWWLTFVLGLLSRSGPMDLLPRFLVAGTAWWVVAGLMLFVWQVGQSMGGPISAMPIAPAYAAATYGGTIGWLWGIFLRAGACTLRVDRPSLAGQRAAFLAWQVTAGAQVLAALVPHDVTRFLAPAASAAGMAVMLVVLRPFAAPRGALPGEPLLRRAIQVGFGFALVHVVLSGWQAAGMLGVWTSPLLADAARHSLNLGFAQLLVFGFAGKMVPGFDGVTMPWPRLYDGGLVFLGGGALARLASLLAGAPVAVAVAGSSGFLAAAGVMAMTVCLLESLRRGAVHRRGLAVARADPGGFPLLTSR